MKIIKKIRTKRAQQLIEFLLVVPFMVIILGIMTEYAYALNINMTLSQGLKTAASSIYSEIKPGISQNDIKTSLETKFIRYLDDNNVPTNEENNIKIGYNISGQTAVFMAGYTYIPAFTLPNVFFNFLPDKFNFLATIAVPSAFLSPNNYGTNITSDTLDGIWGADKNTDLSSVDTYRDSLKKGIMKDSAGRNNILFLVPFINTIPPLTKFALVSWSGTILTAPGGETYAFNPNDSNLYICSPTACASNGKFLNYLTGNNYYNVIFAHDTAIPQDLTTLGSAWAYNKSGTAVTVDNSTDISDPNLDGILKRTLALIETNNSSSGNYDDLDVFLYNPDISINRIYGLSPLGSMVFISNSTDGVDKIINGAGIPASPAYDFGTKVSP